MSFAMRGAKKPRRKFHSQSMRTRSQHSYLHTQVIRGGKVELTGCAAKSDGFRTDAKREALAEVHPWSWAPEDGEREHMQHCERDEGVAALLVALCELIRRRPGWGKGEMPNEAGDEGADRFHDRAGQKRLEREVIVGLSVNWEARVMRRRRTLRRPQVSMR